MEEGRGEECVKVAQPQSPPSNFCVCSCQCLEEVQSLSPSLNVCVLMSMLGGGTVIISILNRVCVCAYVNAYPTLKCACAHINNWRWHSHNLQLFLNPSVCLVNAWRWCNHNPHFETCVCLLMSMLRGGGPFWDYKRKAHSFLKGHSPELKVL